MPFMFSATERDKKFELIFGRQVKLIEGYCYIEDELQEKELYNLSYDVIPYKEVPKKIKDELKKDFKNWKKGVPA